MMHHRDTEAQRIEGGKDSGQGAGNDRIAELELANKQLKVSLENDVAHWRHIAEQAQIKASSLLSPSELCQQQHVQNCNFCDRLDCGDNTSEAKKRIAELAAENDRLKAVIGFVSGFDPETATLTMKGERYKFFAEVAYAYAVEMGMKNYTESRVEIRAASGVEHFVFTLQKLDGKTPHELRLEAERERDVLRLRVEALENPDMTKLLPLRTAAKQRHPLGGAEAQCMEHAITITERERDAAIKRICEMEATQKKTACICGSMRFHPMMEKCATELTMNGWIVLMPHVYKLRVSDEYAASLDTLHLKKIDMSSKVVIVSKDGYMGASTSREYDYAKNRGKIIEFYDTPIMRAEGSV